MTSYLLVLKRLSCVPYETARIIPLGVFSKRKDAETRLEDIEESESWGHLYHSELDIIEVPTDPSLREVGQQRQAVEEMVDWR